jgi:hypothetical protein
MRFSEKTGVQSATVIPSIPASFAPNRIALPALAAACCLILSACSPGADYPSLFPAVHDIPPPRSETRLDANQVQQATEDLISARDRLSAEAQSGQGKNSGNSTNSAAKSAAKASTKSPAKSPPKFPPKSPPMASDNPPATASAGAETK